MAAVVLRGTAHTQLGDVASVGLTGSCGVALTRGRHPKPYAHLDPNEDVVAAAEGDDVVLLLAADGHEGADAAEAAADHVLNTFTDGRMGGKDDAELVRLLTAAGRSAWTATRAHPYPRRGSRTALGVVLVTAGTLRWAVVGDVAVLHAGVEGVRLLNQLEEVFLGGPLEEEHVAKLSDIGTTSIGSGELVVVATDGLLNFASLDAVGAVLAGARDPEQVARALVELACDGGAGDNVAVAVRAAA